MICTITNTTATSAFGALTLNDLDVNEGGSLATGGQRKYPLPFPFGHIGALASAATSALGMQIEDFRYKSVPHQSFDARNDWQQLVQKGFVSMGFAQEALTTARGVEERANQIDTAQNTATTI